jgi:mannose-6-phosphate isomerase-like protein (cupin superfamily)
MEKIDKVWGFEEVWVNEPEYCFKILVLKPGFTSSRHYHQKKKETFLVLKGHCYLRLGNLTDEPILLLPEQQVTLFPGTIHQFFLEVEASEPCVIYEISTHHDDKDVVRQSESHQL